MTEKQKLILALDQVNNIASLLEGNKYQQHLYGHLIQLEVEIKRQLKLVKNEKTTKKQLKANKSLV